MKAQTPNYGTSIRFFLVDIKDITSTANRDFGDEKQLEILADDIIATGCLLKPLLLKKLVQ